MDGKPRHVVNVVRREDHVYMSSESHREENKGKTVCAAHAAALNTYIINHLPFIHLFSLTFKHLNYIFDNDWIYVEFLYMTLFVSFSLHI